MRAQKKAPHPNLVFTIQVLGTKDLDICISKRWFRKIRQVEVYL
jgi:hypothetical protein